MDLSGAELTWHEDGREVAGGVGLSSVDITAGALGSEKVVRAVAVAENGDSAEAVARIRPFELDLLWESDSYTPPGFRGRALPSAGTLLRLEAMPRFARSDGSLIPASAITFTWKRGGYVIPGTSGRGRSRAVIESPSLFGRDTISVEARTSDGLFNASASVFIPSVEPRLVLYQDHPLFGIMYHQAFSDRISLPEVETTFAAIPYFAQANSPVDGSLLYEWRVNDNVILNDPERPYEITIDARGSTGEALLELALSHISNLFLNSSGSWQVTLLGGSGAGVTADPFTQTP